MATAAGPLLACWLSAQAFLVGFPEICPALCSEGIWHFSGRLADWHNLPTCVCGPGRGALIIEAEYSCLCIQRQAQHLVRGRGSRDACSGWGRDEHLQVLAVWAWKQRQILFSMFHRFILGQNI